MIISTLRPLHILLLTALGSGFGPVLVAQDSPLSPPLTQGPQTAPITTLSIDLLAPQRTYIFDPTGASVLANDLDPSIFASTLSSAATETDTAIRDSSQTGHVSPFASGTTRLGLSFSGREGSSSGGTPSPLAAATNPEPGTEIDVGYRSSWGTSSSLGSQSTESSWGMKAFHAERLGRGQSGSSNSGPSLNAERLDRGQSESSNSGPSLNAERLGRDHSGSSNTRPSLNAEDVAKANSADKRIRRIGTLRLNQPETSTTADRPRRSVSPRNSYGTAPANDAMVPSNESLLFAPASSQGYSFGNSPFSAPGGEGELTFLHPNIFANTTLGSSHSSNHDRNMTQGSYRQGLEGSGTLDTSATHYGLAPRSGMHRPLTGTSSKANARKRPSLSNGMLDSESPQ
jgi:hypothetical protein